MDKLTHEKNEIATQLKFAQEKEHSTKDSSKSEFQNEIISLKTRNA